MKEDIRDLGLDELKKEIISMGEKPHRARQIFMWLNRKGVEDFRLMTDLPKDLISKLKDRFIIGALKCEEHLVSKDGTEKFLWRLEDAEYIETVYIKEGKRGTLCLSTQVGCKFKCPFCASGLKKFRRNLRVSEIINQMLLPSRQYGLHVTNIVFMGMGEPLDNFDNLIRAIRTINHPDGIGIGARKITVSTCGIVPGILKLKDAGLQVELSVSLHAVGDKLRDKLVPVNKRYPLKKLINACKEYCKDTKRVITIEYTLIKDMNDTEEDAVKLAEIAKKMKAKINLIDCSPFEGLSGRAAGKKKIKLFKDLLLAGGAKATIRKSKGSDILAACGQLAAKKNK